MILDGGAIGTLFRYIIKFILHCSTSKCTHTNTNTLHEDAKTTNISEKSGRAPAPGALPLPTPLDYKNKSWVTDSFHTVVLIKFHLYKL